MNPRETDRDSHPPTNIVESFLQLVCPQNSGGSFGMVLEDRLPEAKRTHDVLVVGVLETSESTASLKGNCF